VSKLLYPSNGTRPRVCTPCVHRADEIDGNAYKKKSARTPLIEVVALAPKLIEAPRFMKQFRSDTAGRLLQRVSRTAGSSLVMIAD